MQSLSTRALAHHWNKKKHAHRPGTHKTTHSHLRAVRLYEVCATPRRRTHPSRHNTRAFEPTITRARFVYKLA